MAGRRSTTRRRRRPSTHPGPMGRPVAAAFTGNRRASARNPIIGLGKVATAAASRSRARSEEHTSELQSLMRISYAVFCLKKKNQYIIHTPMHINDNYIGIENLHQLD